MASRIGLLASQLGALLATEVAKSVNVSRWFDEFFGVRSRSREKFFRLLYEQFFECIVVRI